MKSKTQADLYSAAAAAVFLLVTAWGNAVAMFVVGAIGLLAGHLMFGSDFARVGTLVAVGSCLVAVIVALALHHL